jgi:hypothetical protein
LSGIKHLPDACSNLSCYETYCRGDRAIPRTFLATVPIRVPNQKEKEDKDQWRKKIERREERNNDGDCGKGEEKYRDVGGLVGVRGL